MSEEQPRRGDRKAVARAWAVHAFTASGAVLGFLSIVATLDGDRIGAFMWLGLALFVDGIDGSLARKARVSELTPHFDGATLDNVIDYLNYVAAPALMIYWFAMAPQGWALPAAAVIMAVSTYTFANTGVKTHDYYFSGFPAIWSLVVLYFHILQTSAWTNLAVIAICCVLTFIPFKYVHPFRVRAWRRVTLPVTALWAATTVRLVMDDGAEPARQSSPLVFWLWVGATLYFAALSGWRSFRLQRAR